MQPNVTMTDNSAWYPDSGATHHVTNDPQTLADPTLYQGIDQLQIGNGSGLSIYSTGSSSLPSRSHPLKLLNILHVLDIKKKLLFVYRLTNDNAVYVEFHADHCIVKDEAIGRPLLKGTVRDGLYLLSQSNNPRAYLGQRVTSDLWHQRLGHLNFKILRHIIATYGLPTVDINKQIICDACLTSKSHRLPFSTSSHRTSKPLELVHSDLWGPSPTTSHLRHRYYVIFVDDHTRYMWLYPLKLKSEVLSVFIDFHWHVERQLCHKLISLQSDWGGEFQALSKYLKEQGITHRISCPHTPAQNGMAERKHRHLVETALSLLKHSLLPHSF